MRLNCSQIFDNRIDSIRLTRFDCDIMIVLLILVINILYSQSLTH